MKMNPNPINKLPTKEKIELEKYVRFLVYKMSQVIVQSRFGEKRKAVSTSKSPFHDWFNLAIEDNSEIQVKAKEAYSNVTPLKDFCICTEILLKTAEGDTLVLETWSLRMTTSDFFCDSPHISYTSLASVYSRMTLLLKSVIAVTRVTPAYKLSSRQSADMYVILFRIYPGEPQVHQLGEHCQKNKIGEVLTPVGTIKVSVSYRSKDDMTITPQKVEKGSPFMMKSDYFKPDMSPQKVQSGGIRIDKNLNSHRSYDDLHSVGAFAPSRDIPEPNFDILEKSFLNRNHLNRRDSNKNFSSNLNVAHLAQDVNIVDLNYNPSGVAESGGAEISANTSSDESQDMRPAFAEEGGDDLVSFFCSFQSAPPIESFSRMTLKESLNGASSQIKKYDEDLRDYLEFLDMINSCDSDEDEKKDIKNEK